MLEKWAPDSINHLGDRVKHASSFDILPVPRKDLFPAYPSEIAQFLCRVLSCLVVSCCVVSCRVMSHVMLCLVSRVMSCCVLCRRVSCVMCRVSCVVCRECACACACVCVHVCLPVFF
jgi:hypothetical protein